MSVKLSVVNEEEEDASPSDYLFDANKVTIGRAEENDLTISDPKRVVSSEHAMVKYDGRSYQLVDRGSKNFTYVGRERITAQEPYELRDGDTFRIGDFRLEFRVVETESSPSPETGETVFDHDFSNPFEQPAEKLQEAIDDLVETYEGEPEQRREAALNEAIKEASDDSFNHSVLRRVLKMLGVAQTDASDAVRFTNASPSKVDAASSDTQSSASPAPRMEEQHQMSDRAVRAPNPVADAVIDTLSEAIAEVVPIPWRFRHEFIGQTIMQAPETQFLHQGCGEVIKEHLMDPAISKGERDERLALVTEAAESVGVHQVAMLNGYKASVLKGSEALLKSLNPDAHERDVQEQNVIFDYVPVLASPVTLERLRTEWQKLRRGDSSAAEQRIFRPAFTKAYLARMTAPRTADHGRTEGSGTQNQHM